ncbi:MAG: hypothetical protein A2005_06720 [Desulfuromonadales bacterium GWC2_61_20]|nr:MAG: hypothetical protein A2005_06720 [Desulfuromonadales bacterium GWC2_61_20]
MTVVRIEPLTRVEGTGRVELQLDPAGRLQAVRLDLVESYRLFEQLVVGRAWHEVPSLVCRICAICSGVHRLAAVAALEEALALEIPPAARLVRELLLLGGQIASHALHLYALILPDLAGTASILELLRQQDAPARQGLALKRLGNRLQEAAGGRVIHPVNIEVGGIVACPARAELQALAAEVAGWEERAAPLLAPFRRAAAYPPGAAVIGVPLAVTAAGDYGLSGHVLALPHGRTVAAAAYRELLGERALASSNAKRAEGAAGPFLTGALARLRLHHQRSGAAWAEVPAAAGIHGNNIAQASELVWALERSRAVLAALLALPADAPLRRPVVATAGRGTAAIEAPRGTLIHHYLLDERGRVAHADIVTPTAINQVVMEQQLWLDLQHAGDGAVLRARAERIVRAYDPCISCSVHLLRV